MVSISVCWAVETGLAESAVLSTFPNPKSPGVKSLVAILPFASVTNPLVFVVMLISKSDITVAPLNTVVSISTSSPAKLVGKV